MHDGQNPDLIHMMLVEQGVRKPLTQATPNGTADDRIGLWILDDCRGRAANLGQERRTETGLLGFVVPDGVVQLGFGEFIERRKHRLDPSLSVAKHVLRRTRRERARVQCVGAPLRFLDPQASVLVGRELVETLEEPTRKPSTGSWL